MRPRATHFLALRLANCETAVKNVVALQERLKERLPLVGHSFTQSTRLHITLAVVAMRHEQSGQGDLKDVSELTAFMEQFETIVGDLKAPVVELNRLDHFDHEVAFLSPSDPESLRPLAKRIRQGLHENGFVLPDPPDRPFHPHATILKLSKVKRSKTRKIISKFLAEEVFNDANSSFAEELQTKSWGPPQQVPIIELCTMLEPAAPDGFYKVLASWPFLPQ